MKRKYLILIGIILFSRSIESYAEVEYYFETKDVDREIADAMCTENQVTQCSNQLEESGNTWYTWDAGIAYKEKSKFYIGNGTYADTKSRLSYAKCINKTCLDWVQSDYCKNRSDDKFCEYLKENHSTATTEYNYTKCDYTIDLRNSDDQKLVFQIGVTPNEEVNILARSTNGFDEPVEVSYEQSKNKVIFHEKGSDENSFKQEWLSSYQEKNQCPVITFCDNGMNSGINEWYATLKGSVLCKNEAYLGIYIQDTNGGTSSGLTLREDIKFNLFNSTNLIHIDSCQALLSDESSNRLIEILSQLVNIVKIGIPILLLILGSLDLAQAIFSTNEDGIKKAQTRFIKRLIIAVIIFLIPSILTVILTIAHQVWNNISPDFCGIL